MVYCPRIPLYGGITRYYRWAYKYLNFQYRPTAAILDFSSSFLLSKELSSEMDSLPTHTFRLRYYTTLLMDIQDMCVSSMGLWRPYWIFRFYYFSEFFSRCLPYLINLGWPKEHLCQIWCFYHKVKVFFR